ncbi:MAG: hypothetical protein KUG81_01285 [Gammaproteobacteria bacterium]|nr:hypothetical protein [Gammaproteobacteria bacterium]
MEGLLGLSKNINDTNSAVRDLSVLERMDARIEKDRVAEVEAQKTEQLFYEKMYAQADQLLEKDRSRINKKILMAQKDVTGHLDKMGGSRKMFMEQGGLSVMNNMSNDIMQSDEVITYGENKKNLAKILEAKEKGLGHLLAPADLESLENYDASPNGGTISYSGMMAEVEIPPSANFDYGSDIPIENILSFKSNMIKIKQNYKTNYPNRPEPNYLELIAFSKKMGYGGTGSNTIRIREKMIADKQRAAYDKKNKKDPNKISFLNEAKIAMSQIPSGLTVGQINKSTEDGGYGGSLIENLKKTNKSMNKLIGEKFTPNSRLRDLAEVGFDRTDVTWDALREGMEFLGNSKMGLKEAHTVLPFNTMTVAQRVFGEGEGGGNYKIEDGKILNYTPDETMFRMDGVKVTGNNELDPEDHKGNYKVVGLTTALKSRLSDGGTNEEALLVNAYNEDGTIDEKDTATMDEKYTSNAALTFVIALENDNGDLFYKEIDINDPQIKTVMSNTLDADDNLTETVKQENESVALIQNIDKNTSEQQVLFQESINAMDERVFQDPIFKGEGEAYWGANSAGQQNRDGMMKSFYMAFDYVNNSRQGDESVHVDSTRKAIDNEMFTTSMLAGEINDDLKSYEQGNSEEKMIVNWLQGVNSDMEKGTVGYNMNEQLASKWMQLLEMM